MKNFFTEKQADKALRTLVEILENRYDVKIKYDIVDREEEENERREQN